TACIPNLELDACRQKPVAAIQGPGRLVAVVVAPMRTSTAGAKHGRGAVTVSLISASPRAFRGTLPVVATTVLAHTRLARTAHTGPVVPSRAGLPVLMS